MSGERPVELSPIVAALDARRKELGISQRELARRMGAWQSHVSAILTGRQGLGLDVAERMAAALGAHLEVRVGGVQVSPTPPEVAEIAERQRVLGKLLIEAGDLMTEMGAVIDRIGGAPPPADGV